MKRSLLGCVLCVIRALTSRTYLLTGKNISCLDFVSLISFHFICLFRMFSEIINQAPASCSEVQFYADGSWTPVIAKKDNFESVSSPSTRKANAKRSATCNDNKAHVHVVSLS